MTPFSFREMEIGYQDQLTDQKKESTLDGAVILVRWNVQGPCQDRCDREICLHIVTYLRTLSKKIQYIFASELQHIKSLEFIAMGLWSTMQPLEIDSPCSRICTQPWEQEDIYLPYIIFSDFFGTGR